MNHQGSHMGQINRKAHMQNEVNPAGESIATLALFPSSTSLAGSGSRFPDRLSGLNLLLPRRDSASNSNIVPTQINSSSSAGTSVQTQRFLTDRLSGSSFLPHNLNSAAARVGINNRYNNQNLELGLSLHPYGPQNQGASCSNSGVNAVEEQAQGGGDDSSAKSMRRMLFKRSRSPDDGFGEFAIGGSSSSAGGIPKPRDDPPPPPNFQVNGDNNNNTVTVPFIPAGVHVCTCDPNMLSSGNGLIDHGVSDLQRFGEVGETGHHSFQSSNNNDNNNNNNNIQTPNGHMRESHVLLPTQPPPFCTYTSQFVDHVPNFHEALQATPMPMINNITRPINAPAPSLFLPPPVIGGNEAMAPWNSIPSNSMPGPQPQPQGTRGNWASNSANLTMSNANGNANLNLPGSERVPRLLSFHERHMRMQVPSSGTGTVTDNSHSAQTSARADSSDSQRNSITTENQHMTSVTISQPNSISPSAINSRSRLIDEFRNAMENLRNGSSMRIEQLMILDYSLASHMLEARNIQEDMQQPNNIENMTYEELVELEDQIGNVDIGLGEEEIMLNIGREIFLYTAEGNPQYDEFCCICHEEYVHGNEIGRLDCGHRFHVGCVKEWLMIKNTCPICKQMALTIVEDAEMEEEDE